MSTYTPIDLIQEYEMKSPEYVLTVFYRDYKEAVSYTSKSLVNTKVTAREEVKWENCARVVVISDEGQIIFDQVGDFA